jgi:hypothetical protein
MPTPIRRPGRNTVTPNKLLIVTVTPTSDAALSEAAVEGAVRDFGDALEQASTNGQPVVATVTRNWEPALPMPGSVLAALVTVLGDRGHDPEVIAKRIGDVNEDGLWQLYLGPAADHLESLLALPAPGTGDVDDDRQPLPEAEGSGNLRCAGSVIALTADGPVGDDPCGWEGQLAARVVDLMRCPVCGGQVESVPPTVGKADGCSV